MYDLVASHRRMVTDRRRQAAYGRALVRVIEPDAKVLDLGAGLGVLGIMAAKLGAAQVYCVEPAEVSGLIAEMASRNGVADRVTVIQGKGSDVDVPDIDILISVMTGNLLVTEDLLEALIDARDRFLKPGGTMLPNGGRLIATPVDGPRAFQRAVGWATESIEEIDLGAASTFASNSITYDREMFEGAQQLAPSQHVAAVDFTAADDSDLDIAAQFEFEVDAAGTMHGLAAWMSIQLVDEWYSTSPFEAPTHWHPALFPLNQPLPDVVGDQVRCELRRPSGGEWTWVVAVGDHEEFHSTRASVPIGPATAASLHK